MRNVLLLGAGRSVGRLSEILKELCLQRGMGMLIADYSLESAQKLLGDFPNGEALFLDVEDQESLSELIGRASVVVSMLPPRKHILVARVCVEFAKPMFSASYVTPEIQALHHSAEKAGSLILMEMGLDPGIDHMSAQQEIDKIHDQGGEVISFKSFTGGVPVLGKNDNPWHYKFTWNPRNVILAGQEGAEYLKEGSLKLLPHHQVFRRLEEVSFEGLGDFEAYPNRDSLLYQSLYNIPEAETVIRGSLRWKGYCKAWFVLVALGMTDENGLRLPEGTWSGKEILEMFLPAGEGTIENRLEEYLGYPLKEELEPLAWLGLLSTENSFEVKGGSPADFLESLLKEKWVFTNTDQDLVAMQHQIDFRLDDVRKKVVYSTIVFGDTAGHTAMAKTVGLPLAFAVELFLDGKIPLTGVQIPTHRLLYSLILPRLEQSGVVFKREEK